MADRPLNPEENNEKPEMYRAGELPAEHQQALKRVQAEQAEAEAAGLFEAYHQGPEALRRAVGIPPSKDEDQPPGSRTSQKS